MSLDWSWRPSDGVLEALLRGEQKFNRFRFEQERQFLADLRYRRLHPRPTQDELDLARASGEGMI